MISIHAEKIFQAYASDLSRAQTTCKLILEKNKASPIKDFIVDPRIKERNFGVCETEPVKEFQNKVEKAGFNRWIDYVPENAETQEDIYDRCRNFLMVKKSKHIQYYHASNY